MSDEYSRKNFDNISTNLCNYTLIKEIFMNGMKNLQEVFVQVLSALKIFQIKDTFEKLPIKIMIIITR